MYSYLYLHVLTKSTLMGQLVQNSFLAKSHQRGISEITHFSEIMILLIPSVNSQWIDRRRQFLQGSLPEHLILL